MSLRMDDINQKVNTIKLSLQTVEYRLAKHDEISSQTSATLAKIQQLAYIQQLQEQQMVTCNNSETGYSPRNCCYASEINHSNGTDIPTVCSSNSNSANRTDGIIEATYTHSSSAPPK